eukprot:jgi/Antlo1/1152/853
MTYIVDRTIFGSLLPVSVTEKLVVENGGSPSDVSK